MAQLESPFRQFLNVLDTARSVVLNIFFLLFMLIILLMFAAIGGMFGKDAPAAIPKNAALVMAPEGLLVEEYSGDPVGRAISEALGDGIPQVRLRDLVSAIDAAKDDDRIKSLVLDFDSMGGGGPAMYDDLAAAVVRFKASGKPVIAIGDGYDQSSYRVAAEADEIYMHPMGMVFLRGYSAYRNYYKDLIDRFEVEWNVFHAGEFKSYGEPYSRNSMSDEAREANLDFLGDLWRSYTGSVESARALDEGEVNRYIDVIASGSNGDFARVAQDFGLVDGIAERAGMKARVADAMGLTGGADADIPQVDYKDYVSAQQLKRQLAETSKPKIAVIVAEGNIVGGDEPPGVIAAERLIRDIRQAREDEQVKAVVLRVNSGGGSAFASDLIQGELIRLQAAGKPLVVSMGTVAASGGYWISMTADQIWAQPTSITGSIGVVAMIPTFEQTLARYGVYTDGVGTTPLAGALRLDRDLSPNLKQTLQASVDDLYQKFLQEVSDNRQMPVERVDEIARGRVWSGADAAERGLVDNLGNFQDAVASAAQLAGVPDYAVSYIEPHLSPYDRFLIDLFNAYGPEVAQHGSLQDVLMRVPAVREIRRDLERLQSFNDPRGIYATCFCELP